MELLATLTIISILGFSILPKTLETQPFTEKIYIKKILHSILYAQNFAMNSGCHTSVSITNSSFEFKLRDSCNTGAFNYKLKDPNNHNNPYIIIPLIGINLNSNNFPLYFDQNGQARSIDNNNIVNSTIIIQGTKIQQTINITGNNGVIE